MRTILASGWTRWITSAHTKGSSPSSVVFESSSINLLSQNVDAEPSPEKIGRKKRKTQKKDGQT